MPSPFPGMDPYLEQPALWADFHNRLATQIADQLAPLIEPRYVARLATRFVTDHLDPSEVAIMYPDVSVARQTHRTLREVSEAALTLPEIVPAPVVLPVVVPTQIRLVTVEIRDVAKNDLITAIEILSPANKREPGYPEYQHKREQIRGSHAHLLEIDLLRQGRRVVPNHNLPDVPYFVLLTRAGRWQMEVWPLALRDPLPTVPAPLRSPDKDAPLDLRAALSAIYDRARYANQIDYTRPPIPPLDPRDTEWASALPVIRNGVNDDQETDQSRPTP